MANTQRILDRFNNYVIANHVRYPIVIESGNGCRLTDTDGKTYLDLFAGFGAGILGHCHPDLVAAGTKQMSKVWHTGNLLHTEPQSQLAEQVATKGFGGKCFFGHSGADANEAAIKLARLYGKAQRGDSKHEFGRHRIISATKSFHGRSYATMGATAAAAVREGFGPFLPGFEVVQYNSVPAIETALDDDTVAIIVEPIQGEGGVNMPDDDYLPKLRALCDQRDMLLIFDEVWVGCGRTGKWFGHQHWDVTPDIMTLGKAIGCGLAVGGICATDRVAPYFDAKEMGGTKHATTLGGNAVSMAVAARMFEVLERDGLVDHAATLGERIKARLRQFGDQSGTIQEVRGKGLFLGIALNTEGQWFNSATDVVNKALEQGLMINGTQGDVLRLAPPMTVTEEELDEGLTLLENILSG
jgi:acetylornithine/N-succinyldiaminopimelate aminotransferase